MTLELAFDHGSIHGKGLDRVGEFVIEGEYALQPKHLRFEKRYRAHAVRYVGAWDGDEIWGIWSIGDLDVGEFRLWRETTASLPRDHSQ